MSGPLPIKITVTPDGRGSVVIDGHDLSNHVRGVDLSAHLGDPTAIRLDFVNVEVELDGAVDVTAMGHEWATYRLGHLMREEMQKATERPKA